MGSIEDIIHPRDKAIYEKRRQSMGVEELLPELRYERELADFGVYHVKTGDTVEEIAHRFYLNAERLAFVNGIQNGTLYAGSVLSLRDCPENE